MRDHPPIPITDLADNIERLKANDGLKFSQEYEVRQRPSPCVASVFLSVFVLLWVPARTRKNVGFPGIAREVNSKVQLGNSCLLRC